jgi:hypothetical protein
VTTAPQAQSDARAGGPTEWTLALLVAQWLPHADNERWIAHVRDRCKPELLDRPLYKVRRVSLPLRSPCLLRGAPHSRGQFAWSETLLEWLISTHRAVDNATHLAAAVASMRNPMLRRVRGGPRCCSALTRPLRSPASTTGPPCAAPT